MVEVVNFLAAMIVHNQAVLDGSQIQSGYLLRKVGHRL